MRQPTIIALLCLALVACASQPDQPADLDDPAFVSWYESATPYMRNAFFVSLCVGSGLGRGSIDFTLCLGNLRSKAKVRVEGQL